MKSEESEVRTTTPEELAEALKLQLGYRRANQAALYAHLRVLISRTLDPDDPVTGFHGFYHLESGRQYTVLAGETPQLPGLISGLAYVQGMAIEQSTARKVGDFKGAMAGDRYDPAIDRTHCISCEDGDPTGEHAQEELRENARAWLGLVIAVASGFYGPHLPAEAVAPLLALGKLALPADASVS